MTRPNALVFALLACGCAQNNQITSATGPSPAPDPSSATMPSQAPVRDEHPRVQEVSAGAPCFVVYIPGLGNDGAPANRSDAQRRDYWRTSRTDTYGDFVAWSSRESSTQGCTTLVTGYANNSAFWSSNAAGEVARQINDFITENDIPERSLVLVGHSLGALVGRWILNNGVGGALYYNFEGADFARVVRHTKYLLSYAGPHLGSPVADAVYSESGSLCGNFVGWLSGAIGRQNDATDSVRSVTLEPASASGGWMADAGRNRTLYTAAGQRWDSGNGMTQDRLISGAWWCLGLSDCRFGCTETAGDGVITETSAIGLYSRSGAEGQLRWSEGQWIQGRRTDWIRLAHNHNHLRYDDQRLAITDVRDGSSEMNFPASYLAAHGLDLE